MAYNLPLNSQFLTTDLMGNLSTIENLTPKKKKKKEKMLRMTTSKVGYSYRSHSLIIIHIYFRIGRGSEIVDQLTGFWRQRTVASPN